MANKSYISKNSELQIVSETKNLRENIAKMEHPAQWPGGRHPAQWPGGRPASGTSSRIKKFSYSRRGPWKFFLSLPPYGWAGGSFPPVQRAGGTHFSKFSQLAPLFRIFFLIPFLEKIRWGKGQLVLSPR
jgi:hypothetical protein